jgi:uncharacterized protein (TIGR00297 family)
VSLARGELVRRFGHIGCVAFALLLRWLAWWQGALLALAAFVFNWQVLPRIGGRALWRGRDVARGYALGTLLYPVSLLGLVLLFHDRLWMAAAGWGILAVGDGMAGLLGQAVGGPRLPWNPQKRWVGLVGFVAFGAPAAAGLEAWAGHWPLETSALHWPRTLGVALVLALVSALVESLPTTLDDNLTVPVAVALVLPLLVGAEPSLLVGDPTLRSRALVGVAVNGLIVLPAFLTRTIDAPGACSAVAIGSVVTAALGLSGLALLVAFFVLGTAATRMGYRTKVARGIAQEKGGTRGWRHAWANGGVPAFLALMAAMAPPGRRDLLVLAYAAAVAAAAADTCSSEVGKACGGRAFLIPSLRPAPPGTRGAVSLEGTLGGVAGVFVVSAVGAALGLYGWMPVLLVAVAGLAGSFAESLVGTVAEPRGWMGGDLLNVLNTAVGAIVVVAMIKAWATL